MTDSATTTSLLPTVSQSFLGQTRDRPDAVPGTEKSRSHDPSPAPTADTRKVTFPKPLLSSGNQVAAQQDPSAEDTAASGPDAAGHTDGKTGSVNADGTKQLSDDEQKKVQELQRRDREVRAHEQAHKLAGGPYAGQPSFKTVRGPDGRSYAVSGEVKIDTSPVPNNPDATIQKLETVKRAALAPSHPSAQDRQVAADADAKIQKAREEKRKEDAEALEKAGITGNQQDQALGPSVSPSQTGSAGNAAAIAPGSLFNLVA